VLLNGSPLEFDVPPQIINERTLVPMRAIFEALGAAVAWDGDTRTVTAEGADTNVQMTIDSNEMYVNSEKITLDVPPVIIDERTLVPARAVAESFGCDVAWDSDTRTVIISSSKSDEAVSEPSLPPVSEYSIEYDDTNERNSHYMRDFKIENISKTADGKYEITYSLRTFLEGRGTVGVTFRCLDADGAVVDSFSGSFVGTDYTWSHQEASVQISDKTAKIELVLNE
jgi:hypothetical protein